MKSLTKSVIPAITILIVILVFSCKKEQLSISKTITGQKITIKLPSAQKGWIESYGEAENLEAELNKLGFSLDNIQEMNITVQSIEITSSKDNLNFDDVDTVVVKSVSPRTVDALRGIVGKKSTKLQNLNTKKNNGDPIKVGDVKLGIGMLLNRPTTSMTEVTIMVDIDLKLSKAHKGGRCPSARTRPTSSLSAFLPPIDGCALMVDILDSVNLFKSDIGTRSNPGFYDRIFIKIKDVAGGFSGAKVKFYKPAGSWCGNDSDPVSWYFITEFALPSYAPNSSNVFSFVPPTTDFTGPIRMDLFIGDCRYFTKVYP